MSLRRLGTTLGTLTLGLALVASAPSAADGPIDPGPLDPVIELLAPLPVPHTPYSGKPCTQGSDRCIDRTIRRMKKRLRVLASSCQHDAVFSMAYLRVTQDVRRAVRANHFSDPVWLNQVDAVFADLYFDVMDDWHAGRRGQVPQAWQIALRAEDDREMSGLGNFLLAMNAHINRDFSYVLARVGLTAADGRSHKRDHNAYNSRLDALYAPVFEEEARRFDPTFDDYDVGPVEETVAGVIIRGWREGVWRNAEHLVLARTPTQRRLAEQLIEQYAASQARLIRATFASPDSSARDAWCATHG
ncbi:MAG: DUF5995 family protein [Nocardioides sp.]